MFFSQSAVSHYVERVRRRRLQVAIEGGGGRRPSHIGQPTSEPSAAAERRKLRRRLPLPANRSHVSILIVASFHSVKTEKMD
jgi:hypothetical protein